MQVLTEYMIYNVSAFEGANVRQVSLRDAETTGSPAAAVAVACKTGE